MKTVGIEIKGSTVYFYALLKDPTYHEITGNFTKIELSETFNNLEVKEFQRTVFSFFDSLSPDRIAILKRNHKGQQSASPLSFKLEGLIQCYSPLEVEFFHPLTMQSYYKKNEFPLTIKYKYQDKAAHLAFYINELI